jgi:ribosomal protein L29
MKSAELRGMSLDELSSKLEEVEKNLQKLRFKVSNEEEKNVAAIRNHRRDRARIMQAMAEKRSETAQAS